MKRTNFNYDTASITEIADYFKNCSSQCIFAARNRYKEKQEIHIKVEEAYKQYKINKIIGSNDV